MNIANLALARLALRRKELARASPWAQAARSSCASCCSKTGMAMLGGIGGIALVAGLLRTLNAIGLEHFPRAGESHMDGTVVVVSLTLSLAAGLFVGLFPSPAFRISASATLFHEDSRHRHHREKITQRPSASRRRPDWICLRLARRSGLAAGQLSPALAGRSRV